MLIRDRVNLDWGRSKSWFYYVPNHTIIIHPFINI